MGLSLGEYSALCFAGAISFEDGVKLTKARGEVGLSITLFIQTIMFLYFVLGNASCS